ncbi:hypothetical protein SARC_05989 [Sphaeroforma arctica JP610]|uniref:Uncharacterized protein n=1 Tax=Sphaeroforma arctica JP610 TaxID=667725 RepID=A0A0L0FYK0_9EUKA|nr:hypothetical protein SARC_05989 [Sphaeroforma arctica JP610]KNC81699.1 hypothetical protein SARC_05989 [Sphaeroforma arctica JP610]|eukprot:XP_014155601.1 hypothetical protein SARC_05989 [Sphaeroforma arctica JP610]
MKVVFALASLFVATAYGKHGQVEFFNTVDCSGDHVLNSGFDSMQKLCTQQSTAVKVSELGDVEYRFFRLSNDYDTEVLMFPTEAECQDYPLQFTTTEEVAFIRSTDGGKCQVCMRCGDNVKSVKITPLISSTDVNSKSNNENSAGSFAPTTVGALAVAGAAFLLA